MNDINTIDWGAHRFGDGVEVTLTPRPVYAGRDLLPVMRENAGARITVVPLWLMDEDDPYPGEWALGSPHGDGDIFGRGWIASGDVTP
jgi:hypothetical protein